MINDYTNKSSNLNELEKQIQLPLDFFIENREFSSYIVYVDESGDSNLEKIDAGYPIFVLAFCIFSKRHYAETLVPMVQSLKFNYFGHDTIVLHEREIRTKAPPFTFKSKAREQEFILDLSKIIENSKFVLISSAILKNEITIKPSRNAYYIALSSCLENLYKFLIEKNQHTCKTFIVVESRGDREDRELELEFRRICDGDNIFKLSLPFEVMIKSKQVNSTGMQFADLFARPIGRHLLDGATKRNKAFDMLEKKFFCENNQLLGENYHNFGLTLFPKPESKKAKGPDKFGAITPTEEPLNPLD